jgi:hypothetical protein
MTHTEKINQALKVADLIKTQNEIQRTKDLLGRCYVKSGYNRGVFYSLAIISHDPGEKREVIKALLYECCPLTPEIEQAMHDTLTKKIKQIDEKIENEIQD